MLGRLNIIYRQIRLRDADRSDEERANVLPLHRRSVSLGYQAAGKDDKRQIAIRVPKVPHSFLALFLVPFGANQRAIRQVVQLSFDELIVHSDTQSLHSCLRAEYDAPRAAKRAPLDDAIDVHDIKFLAAGKSYPWERRKKRA
jgi:hypothetical protein